MPRASVLEKWEPPPPCTSGKPHEWLLGSPEPRTGMIRGQCRLCDVRWWWPGAGDPTNWKKKQAKGLKAVAEKRHGSRHPSLPIS